MLIRHKQYADYECKSGMTWKDTGRCIKSFDNKPIMQLLCMLLYPVTSQ